MEKVRSHPTYKTLSARLGLGHQIEEHARHVKRGGPNHARAGGRLSWFPVQESGGAWLGLLWPNRGKVFGPQHIAIQSLLHPLPGNYKREQHGAAERASSM